MPRRALIVLLSFGVFAGYGSAFASARWHMRHHAACEQGRWNEHARWDDRFAAPRSAPTPTVAAPQPQTVVVQSPAPAPAPAPQIFVIMPGATSPVPAQVVQAAAPQAVNP